MFLNFGILCLNEVTKNLAANLERSPLMRSYGGSATTNQICEQVLSALD